MAVRPFVFWLVAVAIFGFGTAWGAGPRGRIEGRITYHNGTGVPGVRVVVEGTAAERFTDSRGRFRFVLPPETYSLIFSLSGSSVTESDVEVRRDATVEVNTVVDWSPFFVETVEVYAAARQFERLAEASAAVTSLSRAEIDPLAAHGQLPKLLSFTPGAEVVQGGLYDFNLNGRGFNTAVNRHVKTLIDGRDPSVPVLLGFQDWAANGMLLDDLSGVELVRGPGSSLYGAGAFNGVLNLTTRAPRDSPGGKLRLTAGELDTRNVELRHAGALGDAWYFKVTGGYRHGADFADPRVTSVEYASGLLPTEVIAPPSDRVKIAFGSLRFDRYSSSGSRATFELGSSHSDGQIIVTSAGRTQATDSRRPWARFNFASTHWDLVAYYTGQKADDQFSLGTGQRIYFDSYNAEVEMTGRAEFAAGRGQAIAGVSYGDQSVDSASPEGLQTVYSSKLTAERKAVFGQVEFEWTERLRGLVSGRLDDSSLHDTRFSPRAALIFAITPAQAMRFTFSDAFQRPSVTEFFLRTAVAPPLDLSALETSLAPVLGGVELGFDDIPLLVLGNRNLSVEEVRSFEVGYSAILKSRLFLNMSYYRNRLENFTTNLLPQVGTSFGRLNPDYAAYRPPPGLSPAAEAAVLGALQAALPPETFAAMSNDLDGAPILALFSFRNFGRADTQGVELGLNWRLFDRWRLDFNYTHFDYDIRDDSADSPLIPNTPDNQLNLGLFYRGGRVEGSLRYRWVDDFLWSSGIYVGPVPDFNFVDLNLAYAVNRRVSLGLDATNVFDNRHYEMFGGALLSRRVLTHATYSW